MIEPTDIQDEKAKTLADTYDKVEVEPPMNEDGLITVTCWRSFDGKGHGFEPVAQVIIYANGDERWT